MLTQTEKMRTSKHEMMISIFLCQEMKILKPKNYCIYWSKQNPEKDQHPGLMRTHKETVINASKAENHVLTWKTVQKNLTKKLSIFLPSYPATAFLVFYQNNSKFSILTKMNTWICIEVFLIIAKTCKHTQVSFKG